MRVIYNEGRVAGFSAYELYVRQQLADGKNPEDLMSETDWVESSTAKGGSMILKIAAGTTAGYHDYLLPSSTGLCACNPLQATLFEGTVETISPDGLWATHVIDNGRLIRNDEITYPVTPGAPVNVPAKANPGTIPSTYRKQCVDYMKISSALAIQPGEWVPREPFEGRGLKPNLSQAPFIRIAFSEITEVDFYILISGFMSVAAAETFIEPEEYDATYYSGEFLGPVKFPWASKVETLITTDSLKGYLDWYLDATLTTAQYQALPVKENKYYFTRKE